MCWYVKKETEGIKHIVILQVCNLLCSFRWYFNCDWHMYIL